MVSKAEHLACISLREILKPIDNGKIIQDSQEFQELLSALEWYIPEVLGEKYENPEVLDGVYSGKAIKIAKNEAVLIGMCIFISDQTLTPVNLKMRVSESTDDFEWFYCRLGEETPESILRIPYSSSKWGKYMYNLQVDYIDWVYEIEYKKS